MNAIEHSDRQVQRTARQVRVFQAVDLSRESYHAIDRSDCQFSYNAMLGTASRGAINRRSISGSVIA